jgi:hypothetical protein
MYLNTADYTEECARIPEPICTNVVLPDTMTQVLDIIRIVSEKQSASFYGFKLVPSDTDAKLSFRTDSFDLFALKDHFDIITGLNITPIDEHFIVELRIADLYMASR